MNARPPSFRRAVTLALLLVFIDAFLLNQGVIAALIGTSVLFVAMPLTFLPRFAPVRSPRLRNLAIYFTAAVLVLVFNAANNRIAQARAEKLVVAVKAYHAKHEQYPQSLQELVPEFIEHVPLAKYTLVFNRFFYAVHERRAVLFYVHMPPFGHPTYSFGRDQWIYYD